MKSLDSLRRKVLKKEKGYGLLFPLFFALSKIYCSLSLFRKKLYEDEILKRESFGIPVISVGNIVAGGSGKTPLVEFIYKLLEDSGFSPAIVTRGYKGEEKGPSTANDDVKRFGDEAAIYARRGFFTVVSKNKVEGVYYALEKGANVVILDDGFQTVKIKPLVNIVVIDPFNPFGGGYCLPLGLLREPVSVLDRADCFVISRSNLVSFEKLNSVELFLKTFKKPIFRGEQRFKGWIDEKFSETVPPDKDINVFCGIGNPYQFKSMLETEGFDIEKFFTYPDHYDYTDEDIEKLGKYPNLVTTEKDLIKLKGKEINVQVPILETEVFGLKEFILNRIKNVEKHEEMNEQKDFIPDGVSISQILKRRSN